MKFFSKFNIQQRNLFLINLTLSNVATPFQSKNNFETTLKCLLGLSFNYIDINKVYNLCVSLNFTRHVTFLINTLKI